MTDSSVRKRSASSLDRRAFLRGTAAALPFAYAGRRGVLLAQADERAPRNAAYPGLIRSGWYTPGLTARTERSRLEAAAERARDGGSRAGTTGSKVAREPRG